MMTKRERFLAFLSNKPVDRVPVAFFHHFCRPEDCPVVERIAHRSRKTFTSGRNFSPATELAKEVG